MVLDSSHDNPGFYFEDLTGEDIETIGGIDRESYKCLNCHDTVGSEGISKVAKLITFSHLLVVDHLGKPVKLIIFMYRLLAVEIKDRVKRSLS